jgi:hypothetical protein
VVLAERPLEGLEQVQRHAVGGALDGLPVVGAVGGAGEGSGFGV